MMGVKKPSHFCRKVRNQVLKNREIEYVPKYYVFGKMEHSDYKLLNDFYIAICKKNKTTGNNWTPNFYSPKDYSWENDGKYYYFLCLQDYGNRKIIFMLPHNWLLQYDLTIPIFIGPNHSYYLDLEKNNLIYTTSYLIRDRFYRSEGFSPSVIGKGNEDWCITYSNIFPPRASIFYSLDFSSSLLIENIDFSEFDAKIIAEGLFCPVDYDESIKLKGKPQSGIGSYTLVEWDESCFCVACRMNYRAIEVIVILSERGVTLLLLEILFYEY